MARPPKKLVVDEGKPPITPAEVAEMWRQSTSCGPYPSPRACELMAELLTFHREHGARNHIGPRKAAQLLQQLRGTRQALANYLLPVEETRSSLAPPTDAWPWLCFRLSTADYDKLVSICTVLDEGLPVLERLSALGGTSRAPIWDMAAQIAWEIAREALQTLGRPAGTTSDSVAVKFAAIATRRMGFPGATPSAVSKRCEKFTKKMRHSDAP